MEVVTLDRLLGALPELGDFANLRDALLSASVVDTSHVWSNASAYATYDKRSLSADALRDAIAEAARVAHTRVDTLYASLHRVLEALAADDLPRAARELLSVGAQLQAEDNVAAAMQWFRAADRVAERAADRGLRARALWLLAIAHLGQGDTDGAETHYSASMTQAAAAGNLEGVISAVVGLGNVAGYQGRHNEALTHFEEALRMCANGYPRRRAMLFMNIANMLIEQSRLTEASERLAEASSFWGDLLPADYILWYNTRGMLALERGEIELAEGLFHQALEVAPSQFERAMVLDNLAELFIRQGNLSEAESLARSAEEAALRASSPRALAEIYTRLGKIFRLRADPNGVTFFEKAVEICRGRRYPHTEANAYLEYGIFRRLHGDLEEARSYFERARQLYAAVGAEAHERIAADQLALR